MKLRINKLVAGFGFLILVGVLVSTYFLTAERAVQCMSVRCTYYENHVPSKGVCGSRPGDTKNCYCFKATEAADGAQIRIEGGPSNLQIGCVSK